MSVLGRRVLPELAYRDDQRELLAANSTLGTAEVAFHMAGVALGLANPGCFFFKTRVYGFWRPSNPGLTQCSLYKAQYNENKLIRDDACNALCLHRPT